MPETRLAVAAVLVVAGAVFGCGPSMRNLVESDMRFEHCYRIDDDARTPLEQKRACWRDWTTAYTKGQDRSRVAYARERLKVLDCAAATDAAPAAGSVAVACPTPSSPYAPPPSVTPAAKGDVAAANASPGVPAASTCSDTCTKAWRTCVQPCNAGDACVSTCDANFRACMKPCY